MEKLRARAGVSNGSFFHQFAAKEDLAAELLVNCVIDYQAAIITALARCDDARTGVAAIVRTHIRWVMDNQSKARFMLDDARAAWFAKASGRLKTHNAAFRCCNRTLARAAARATVRCVTSRSMSFWRR